MSEQEERKGPWPYKAERRDGAWLVIDQRDDSIWTTLGGSERGHQRALNLAREHNMELRHQQAVERRRAKQ